MNKMIEIKDRQIWEITTKDGDIFEAKYWFEKSKDKHWIKFPKDNPTRVGYVSLDKFDELKNADGVYEFSDNKRQKRTFVGGGWRAKLTTDEATEIEQLENDIAEKQGRIDEIKKLASSREVDKNSPEYIKNELRKLLVKKFPDYSDEQINALIETLS